MDDYSIGASIGIIIIIIVFMLAGWYLGSSSEQTKAIKAGVAQYVCDPETGETKLEYIGGNK